MITLSKKNYSINSALEKIKESATLAINTKVKTLRAESIEVSHFGFGQSPFKPPKLLQEALKKHADKSEYIETQGLLTLRQSISDFYASQFDYHFEASQIFIGPGSKELLFQLLMVLEGTLLLPQPSWVSYAPQAEILNKPLDYLHCDRKNSFTLKAEVLNQYCEDNPTIQKILLLNNPNNPTGRIIDEKEMSQLADICRKYNITVISDEIYALVRFEDTPHVSMAHYYPEGTIVTSGLSKAFGAGGYRLGFAALPSGWEDVANLLKTTISETYSAVCAPVQYAAADLFKNYASVEPEVSQSVALLQQALYYTWQRFISLGLNCPKPQGAFYCLLDFSPMRAELEAQGIYGSIALAEKLLSDYHVATLPGSHFCLPDNELTLRISPVDFDGQALINKYTSASFQKYNENNDFLNIVSGCDRIERFVQDLSRS